jgi:hypothetical protein
MCEKYCAHDAIKVGKDKIAVSIMKNVSDADNVLQLPV